MDAPVPRRLDAPGSGCQPPAALRRSAYTTVYVASFSDSQERLTVEPDLVTTRRLDETATSSGAIVSVTHPAESSSGARIAATTKRRTDVPYFTVVDSGTYSYEDGSSAGAASGSVSL